MAKTSYLTDTSANLTIAADGRVVIPLAMRGALGLSRGGKVIARLRDGAVVLQPLDTAIRNAQAMVARYVPSGSGLIETLIAERRAAAAGE